MVNILVFGYYFRQNWGDDVFEHVFKNYIFKGPDYNLTFKNLDDLATNVKEYNNIDKVVIGGGDVINDYFFSEDNIKLFRKYFANKPIYFIGIGLTYPGLINIMDIGDYFFMRNSTDYKLTKERFSEMYSYYIPDIAFNLLNEVSLTEYTKPIKSKSEIRKIGIMIPGTWVSNISKKDDKIIDKICNLVKELALENEIHFIPFDTTTKPNNSDILLINEIKKQLKTVSNVHYIIPQRNRQGHYLPISVNEMIEYFKNLDITICGRFHATILSIITNTPFVAIYSSTKLKNLKKDVDDLSNYFIELGTNKQNIPNQIDVNSITTAIEDIKNNYNDIVSKLKSHTTNFNTSTQEFNVQINNLMSQDDKINTIRQSPPQYITSEDKTLLIRNTVSSILRRIFNKISVADIDYILRGRPIVDILPRTKFNNMDSFRKILTEEILWSITGDPYAPYYYGLHENIFKTTFLSQLEWIINDYYENYKYRQPNKSNITIINKNFQRLHRSGWQYIVNNIVMQLNNNDNITNPLIIDTYIDKTFHWNKEFYYTKNIIPYVNPWVGFIHHTYSDYNNQYNCLALFKDSIFLQSLQSCKALIVMTNYLGNQIKETLHKLKLTHINVHTIIHPTENTDIQFTWDKFMNNDTKKVIQVGNWLRDVFGIYRVSLPSTSLIKQKSILKNRNSDNYFPPEDFLDNLYSELNNSTHMSNKNPTVDICRNSFKNMHIKGLYNYIVEMEESVDVIEFLDNESYDELLSQNIVFLNLVDASACNTLIECVTRNTPIIVNPIPPVVEILGKDYPLYYNNYYEVSKILDNPIQIKSAYDYLVNMPKDLLDINNFITELTTVVNQYTN